jgi:hypothetical protein
MVCLVLVFSHSAFFEKNTGIKVGGLITTLIYLFLIYGSLKLFYKHFQSEKKLTTNHETNRPQIDHLFTLPASIM